LPEEPEAVLHPTRNQTPRIQSDEKNQKSLSTEELKKKEKGSLNPSLFYLFP
jgi:hypothetical protein